jgi:hypothetical protein
MSASFSQYNSKDLTIITFHGEVPIQAFLNMIHEYKKAGFTKYEIYDLQIFMGDPLSFEEVKNLANYIYNLDPLRPKGGKSAIIHHRSDHLGFGITRQLIALLESEKVYFELNAFYSMDEALEWLSVAPEPEQ